MKKMLFSAFVLSLSLLMACNNDATENATTEDTVGKVKQETPAAEATALKDHVCSDKCEDGNHFYAHGERGHICSEECMKEHKL